MTITYAPRVTVHPDRYGADRSQQVPMIRGVIIHTSEQSGKEDPDDAEDLGAYMTTPGDRPSPSRPGQFFGASYHAVTDTHQVIPCTLDTRVAYAAGGANRHWLHICIPVRIRPRSATDTVANQTRAQWLDPGSRPYIRQVAEYIVDRCTRYRVPIRRIAPEQMAAGAWGYADHWTASRAFAKSNHTDVGDAFPWDVLEADIAKILETQTPPKEEDPMEFIKVHDQDTNTLDAATFIRFGIFARWVQSGADKQAQAAQFGVNPKWRSVPRISGKSELGQLTLIGPQPQGDGVITSIDDFARTA